MSHVILVDGNNIGVSSHFIHDNLTDPVGRPIGAVYGFVRRLRPILVQVQEETSAPVKVVVLWDSAMNWRKEVFDGYKASRRSDEPDEKMEIYYSQMEILRYTLRILGIHQTWADGYEADDMAGYLTRSNPKTYYTLVSDDKDWLQLITDRVHVYQPRGQKLPGSELYRQPEYVTKVNFEQITKCSDTEEFVKMKGIMGDKGDDVPGAEGVGEVTALKYLRGELGTKTKAGKPAKKFAAVESWMLDPDGYDRSLKLVDLRNILVDASRLHIIRGQFDEQIIMQEFIKLGFDSMLENYDTWVSPFRGTDNVLLTPAHLQT